MRGALFLCGFGFREVEWKVKRQFHLSFKAKSVAENRDVGGNLLRVEWESIWLQRRRLK